MSAVAFAGNQNYGSTANDTCALEKCEILENRNVRYGNMSSHL